MGLYICPLIASVSQESPCVTQAIFGMAHIKALFQAILGGMVSLDILHNKIWPVERIFKAIESNMFEPTFLNP